MGEFPISPFVQRSVMEFEVTRWTRITGGLGGTKIMGNNNNNVEICRKLFILWRILLSIEILCTLNFKAVWYAVENLSVFNNACIVPGVVNSGRINFKLASAVERCLVHPCGFFALEKPSRLRRGLSWVATVKNNLGPPAFIDFSSDGCDLCDVSHGRGFANNLRTPAFTFLGGRGDPELVLFSCLQLCHFKPIRAWRALMLDVTYLPAVFDLSENIAFFP